MARRGGKRAGELVQRLVELGVARLVADLDLPEERARASMRALAHDLCQVYGGQRPYVPQDLELGLSERDLALWDAFTGHNVAEVALAFKLSERQVYYVVNHIRHLGIHNRHQGKLPGFEDDSAA